MQPVVTVIQDARLLSMPEVRAALAPWNKFGVEGWYQELAARMVQRGAVVIIGSTVLADIQSAAIVTVPMSVGEELPWVVHFHNDGPRSLTREMVNAVVAFVGVAGYTAFKALNQSGHPDKVWLRAFRDAGKPIFIGSTYLFNLSEVDNGRGDSAGGGGSRDRPKPIRRRKQAKDAEPEQLKPARRKLVKPDRAPGKSGRVVRHDAAGVRGAGSDRRRKPGRPPGRRPEQL